MTKQQHARHAFLVVLAALGSVLVEVLAPAGALGHYHWSATVLTVVAWGVRALNLRMPPPAAGAAFLLAVPFLGGSMCIRTPVGPTPPADAGTRTPGFVDCSEAAIHAAALNLLPDIATDLAMAPAASLAALEAGVATLAAQVGVPLATAEFGCAINWILSRAQAQVTSTADDVAHLQVANALAYFKAHPMTFAATGQ